jgi:uncharacterized repeat protein (TIGR01451 family)
MITHSDFQQGLQPLAEHYESLPDLRVKVVDVQDVYDEFSGGILYPGAIRAFLAYALANWDPAPSYVLLVGDGHYDYIYNSSSTDLEQYLPPYMAVVDPWLGEAATDNRYVSVSGEDAWPDMIIGRFPVNNQTEMQAMVAKTLAYQQGPIPGDWNKKILFVTDNPDDGGQFYDLADEIINDYLPDPYRAEAGKIYYGLDPYFDPATTKAAILNTISEGRLMVSYTGHSAISWWAEEQLLRTSDLPSLTNTEIWPIMLPLTCLEGQFSYRTSGFPSLSETIIRLPGKGAVAAWSATGYGVAAGHDYLQKGLFEAVFFDGVRHLGDATLAGKRFLWEQAGGGFRDLIETYVLLGDPLLRINALDADLRLNKTVEPVGQISSGDVLTYTLTFTNAGPSVAHSVVLSDVLPTSLIDVEILYESPEVVGRKPGERYVWEIEDLAPGAEGEIRLRATVDPSAGAGTVVNIAELRAAEPELKPSDNSVSVSNEIVIPEWYIYLPVVLRQSP